LLGVQQKKKIKLDACLSTIINAIKEFGDDNARLVTNGSYVFRN
jgi:hypothetical protein